MNSSQLKMHLPENAGQTENATVEDILLKEVNPAFAKLYSIIENRLPNCAEKQLAHRNLELCRSMFDAGVIVVGLK